MGTVGCILAGGLRVQVMGAVSVLRQWKRHARFPHSLSSPAIGMEKVCADMVEPQDRAACIAWSLEESSPGESLYAHWIGPLSKK